MLTVVPRIKIEPNGITITKSYYSDQDLTSHKNGRRSNLSNCYLCDDIGTEKCYNCNKLFLKRYKDNGYTTFSKNSQRNFKRAFILLLAISRQQTVFDTMLNYSVKFTLNMITLTLSAKQGIFTDYQIKSQLLNHWFILAKRKFGLKNYIWRAEPQVNGNIHFHIISNCYINYQNLRDSWNNVQSKLGLINLFNEKHHHINPNSTDVHKIVVIKNAASYVRKYINKMLEKSIQGHINTEIKGNLKGYLIIKDLRNNEIKGTIRGNFNNFNEINSKITGNILGTLTELQNMQFEFKGEIIFKHDNKTYTDSNFTALVKDYRAINGKIWDCTQNLKPSFKCTLDCFYEDIERLDNLLDLYDSKVFIHDHFKFLPLEESEMMEEIHNSWKIEYLKYIQHIEKGTKPIIANNLADILPKKEKGNEDTTEVLINKRILDIQTKFNFFSGVK